MAETTPFKYRAFLSYSHRDKGWATWLHRSLESHRIDKDLVGRATPTGPVPSTLRPIFLDREDFSAGHSLNAQTLAALEASQFMVVICSPNAAKSHYVNEEIRSFKALGRGDRVIPLIVDGDPERECFPPALRFKVGPDGALTGEHEEPIAADARKQADGQELAKHKVIAGLLQLRLDEIVKRGERERRRQNRVRTGIAAAIIALAVLASGGAAFGLHYMLNSEASVDQALENATNIVNRLAVRARQFDYSRNEVLERLEEAEGYLKWAARLGKSTPRLQYRKAWMSLAFARNYGELGQSDRQRVRALEAQQLLAGLAKSHPNDLNYQRELAAAHYEVGNVLMTREQNREALESFRAVLAISEQLLKLDPKNVRWRRDRSYAFDKIGDILIFQRNVAGALEAYQAGLAIDKQLAEDDPADAQARRDLAVSYVKIGDILEMQGNRTDALTMFQASLVLRQQRAATEPKSTGAQRDITVALIRIADILVDLKQTDEGQKLLAEAVAIRTRLVASDGSNALWQRDLSVASNKLADVLLSHGHPQEALRILLGSVLIAEHLARLDPDNVGWERDLSIVYSRISSLLWRHVGLPDVATAFHNRSMALTRSTASLADTLDLERQTAEAAETLGTTLTERSEAASALAAFKLMHLLRRSIAGHEPENQESWRAFAASHARLAKAHAGLNQRAEAVAELQKGRAILADMVAASADRADWLKDLARFDAEIARVSAAAQGALPIPR